MTNSHAAEKELIIGNFTRGGGASTGIEMALDRPENIAINHDPKTVAMHRANHPHTLLNGEDVWSVNPIEACNGRSVGLARVAAKWAQKTRPQVITLENVFANSSIILNKQQFKGIFHPSLKINHPFRATRQKRPSSTVILPRWVKPSSTPQARRGPATILVALFRYKLHSTHILTSAIASCSSFIMKRII